MSGTENSETLLINEILVLVTFGVMVVSIASCVVMYIFRDYRRKDAAPPVMSASIAERKKRNIDKLDRSLSTSGKTTAVPPGILKKDNTSGSQRHDNKRIRIGPAAVGEDSLLFEEDDETEPLMIEEGRILGSSQYDQTEEKSLHDSAEVALSVGITLTLHTTKSSRSAKISLAEGKLICRIKKSMTLKVVQIDLREIRAIYAGKVTPNFKRDGLHLAPEDSCFSIVTVTKTFDFEAMYKVERDAIVAGIETILSKVRNS